MAQLLLPIMLKTENLFYHDVSSISTALTFGDQKIITGSLGGEIVIWKLEQKAQQSYVTQQIQQQQILMMIVPQLILLPSINQETGHVTFLSIIQKPLKDILSVSPLCILSVHQAGRVRIWDLNDGRCINISQVDVFPEVNEVIFGIPIRKKHSRFYIFSGYSNTFYVFDIWKMKVVTQSKIGDQQLTIRCMDINYEQNQLYIVDNENTFYSYLLDNFGAEKYNIFEEYKKDRHKYKKEIYDMKTTLQASFKLDGLGVPVQLLYTPHSQLSEGEDSIMAIVYEKQICFYHKQDFQQKLQLLITNYQQLQQQESEIQKNSSLSFDLNKPSAYNFSLNQNFQNFSSFQSPNLLSTSQMQNTQNSMKEKSAEQTQGITKLNVKFKYTRITEYEDFLFNRIEFLNVKSQILIFIVTKDGSVFLIQKSDIDKIYQLIDISEEADLSFSFGQLSFFKDKGKRCAMFNPYLYPVVLNNIKSREIQSYCKSPILNLAHFDQFLKIVVYYNRENTSLQIAKLEEIICKKENSDKIQNVDTIFKLADLKTILANKSYTQEQSNNYTELPEVLVKNGFCILLSKNILEINHFETSSQQIKKFLAQSCFSYKFRPQQIQEQIGNYQINGPQIISNNNVFHPYFLQKYGTKLKQCLGDDRITVSLVQFIDKKEPYHFLGTTSGNVYAFPLVFDDNTNNLIIYCINTGIQPIHFIGYIRNYLVISTENSQLLILKMEDFLEKFQNQAGSSKLSVPPSEKDKPSNSLSDIPSLQSNSNIQLQVQSLERMPSSQVISHNQLQHNNQDSSSEIGSQEQLKDQQKSGQSQEENKAGSVPECTVTKVDISKLKVFDKMINAPVKRVMKVYPIQSLLEEPSVTDLSKDTKNYLKNIFCLVLSNNAVCIYSCKTNNIVLELKGNTQSIYVIYYHPILDYIIIITKDLKLHFWSINSGRFIKSDEFSNYSSIFTIDKLLEQTTQKITNYNDYNTFIKVRKNLISKVCSFLEFNNRSITDLVNFQTESSKQTRENVHFYEFMGYLKDPRSIIGDPNKEVNLLYSINERLKQPYQSKCKKLGMNILKMKLNKFQKEDFYSVNYILYANCKLYNSNLFNIHQANPDQSAHKTFSYLPFIYPWGVNKRLDEDVGKLLLYKRPVFNYIIGTQGLGLSFSFPLQTQQEWQTSNFMSTQIAMCLVLSLIYLKQYKDGESIVKVIQEFLQLITKHKKKISPNFKNISLPILAQFSIDNTNEMLFAANNLIINIIQNKEEDYQLLYQDCFELFKYNLKEQGISDVAESQKVEFSLIEVQYLIITCYINLHGDKNQAQTRECLMRIISGINLNNCISNPILVAPCIRILTEGIQQWKLLAINHKELFLSLIFIYFCYNTGQEYLEMLKDIPNAPVKKLATLEQFLQQSPEIRKRMKILTIKAILSLAENFLNDFLLILKQEIQAQDRHILYPCSIIDIIRNYLQSQADTIYQNLPIFIEMIIKPLDPNNTLQRKICIKSSSLALQLIYKTYTNVQYSQETQRYAVGTHDNKVIIYDMRTAAKWRVLNGHSASVTSVCFDSKGKHIASFSLIDKQIYIWKVGQTGFYGTIIGMSGKSMKQFSPKVDLIMNELYKVKPQLAQTPNINDLQKIIISTSNPQLRVTLSWSNNDETVILKVGDKEIQQFKI